MQKIAFLFLIYNTIQQEELWHLFFKDVDPAKYVIYIHYKEQKALTHFENRKLKHCIPTKYGHISLVQAHNLLNAEALKDPDVSKCVFLSHACIPMKSFATIYDKLTADNNSYINEWPQSCNTKNAKTAFTFIDEKEVFVSHEWMILNRPHAQLCIDHSEYLKYFEKCFAPEESYYITIIRKFMNTDVVYFQNAVEGATTFTNWFYKGAPYKYAHYTEASYRLKNYAVISEEELAYLMAAPCLFARKFNGKNHNYCYVSGIKENQRQMRKVRINKFPFVQYQEVYGEGLQITPTMPNLPTYKPYIDWITSSSVQEINPIHIEDAQVSDTFDYPNNIDSLSS